MGTPHLTVHGRQSVVRGPDPRSTRRVTFKEASRKVPAGQVGPSSMMHCTHMGWLLLSALLTQLTSHGGTHGRHCHADRHIEVLTMVRAPDSIVSTSHALLQARSLHCEHDEAHLAC